MAPRRSTDNPRSLLLPCSKVVVDPCDLSHGSHEGGSGTGKAAWAEKTVSKRNFDTGPCNVGIPRTSHIMDRRITEMSLIVQVLPKIKTIVNKRQSPADREFRILSLCTCVLAVICNTKWRQTHFMRNANKESEMPPRKVVV